MAEPRLIVATSSLRIICKADFVATMNAALQPIDSSGDPQVLKTPLYLSASGQTTPVAYYTVWSMDDAQRTQLNAVFAQNGWMPLRGSEGKILGPTDSVPAFSTNQRWWLFDPARTSNEYSLGALGLVLPQGE